MSGESPRCSDSEVCNLVTLAVHFLHPMMCTVNYLSWVRYQRSDDDLGDARVDAYLALTIISMLAYFLLSSAFYILAHRWPLPLHRSSKRTSWGVFINLLLSDMPIFILEVDMTWAVGWASAIQAITMVITILSFATSGIRSWFFLVGKYIRHELRREGEGFDRVPEPGSPGLGTDGPATPGHPQYESMQRGARDDHPPGLREREDGFFLPAAWMEEQHVVPLLCITVWLISTVVSLVNYVVYLRTEDATDRYGAGLGRAYLGFVIISLLVYFTIGSTMWLWSWKYSSARILRRRKTVMGILAMFFFSNCPLWAMDYRTVDVAGVSAATQLMSLLFQSVTWLAGAVTLWLTYAHKMTRDMHEGRCLPAVAASPYRGRRPDLGTGESAPGGVPMQRAPALEPEYKWRAMFSWQPPPHAYAQPVAPQAAQLATVPMRHSSPSPPPASGFQSPSVQQPVFEAPPPSGSVATFESGQPAPLLHGPGLSLAPPGMALPPPGTQVVRTPPGAGRAGGIVPEGGVSIGQVPSGQASPTFSSPPRRQDVVFHPGDI
eukprot:TRINITY_DN19551_c0_g1_i1.p1 TRINITY_DN19551_c0_g1~~TRINITY_DN19551_c0_g1_i1.p1  ORF type:complete len:573 (+),score=164.67 TRINITY_DN19551_c0_g1_i1:77-1720(+)